MMSSSGDIPEDYPVPSAAGNPAVITYQLRQVEENEND